MGKLDRRIQGEHTRTAGDPPAGNPPSKAKRNLTRGRVPPFVVPIPTTQIPTMRWGGMITAYLPDFRTRRRQTLSEMDYNLPDSYSNDFEDVRSSELQELE